MLLLGEHCRHSAVGTGRRERLIQPPVKCLKAEHQRLSCLLRRKIFTHRSHFTAVDRLTRRMNEISTDQLAASREQIRGFGQHYDYDVSYLEALMDASPGAFQVFEAAMGMGRFRKAAPIDLL